LTAAAKGKAEKRAVKKETAAAIAIEKQNCGIALTEIDTKQPLQWFSTHPNDNWQENAKKNYRKYSNKNIQVPKIETE